jgi:uncharacterized membrane protein YsdA (DUF1294 family)/cold shock CspA family protein
MGIQLQLQGKITSWNDEKGYGFITPGSSGDQIFVHIKAFKNRGRRPQINQYVTYTHSKDRQGRPCAIDVSFVGKQRGNSLSVGKAIGPCILGGLFLGAIGISEGILNRSFLIVSFYLILSLVTFIVYALDKNAAQNDRWRTPEAKLHFLALIGGWPGALVAQQMLRHKSKKKEFRFVFWITVILNCSVSIFLLTPKGLQILELWIQKILNVVA